MELLKITEAEDGTGVKLTDAAAKLAAEVSQAVDAQPCTLLRGVSWTRKGIDLQMILYIYIYYIYILLYIYIYDIYIYIQISLAVLIYLIFKLISCKYCIYQSMFDQMLKNDACRKDVESLCLYVEYGGNRSQSRRLKLYFENFNEPLT